jgi:hypothetical protein
MKNIKPLFFLIFILIANSVSAQTELRIASGQGNLASMFYFQNPIPEVFYFSDTRVWNKSFFRCAVLYYLPLTHTTKLKIDVSYEGSSSTTIAGIVITPTEYIGVVRTSHEVELPPGNYNIGVAPVHSNTLGKDLFTTVFVDPYNMDCSCMQDVPGKLSISLRGNMPASNSFFRYNYDAAGNRIARSTIILTNLKSSVAEITPTVLEDNIIEAKIYPNPTKGQLTIEIPHANNIQNGSIIIYNLKGQMIMRKPIDSHRENIDISAKANGMYIMQINMDGKISSWKIIKEM